MVRPIMRSFTAMLETLNAHGIPLPTAIELPNQTYDLMMEEARQILWLSPDDYQREPLVRVYGVLIRRTLDTPSPTG